MHEPPMRLTQVPTIRDAVETIAVLDHSAVAALQRAGVWFTKETEFDEAGPPAGRRCV